MFLEFQMYHITNGGDNPANVDFQIIKDRVGTRSECLTCPCLARQLRLIAQEGDLQSEEP